MAGAPRVFTIPPGVPFVDALARGLLARFRGDPLGLAEATVLLPTRRAGRALADAFLRQSDGAALLLPRMAPLGELDEADDVTAGPGAATLPPAISDLRRRMMLARRILALRGPLDERITPARAALLAEGLADLLDQVQTERLSFDRLAALVEGDGYAVHWEITLEFLRLVTEAWPMLLAREGCIDPAERRNRLLDARAVDWAANPPAGPVIAAGSTGSIPATAALLEIVAGLPDGAVVLPGLDTALTAEDAARLGPTHPQYGMARLLARIGVDPDRVPGWAHDVEPASPPARAALLACALRQPRDDVDAPPAPALDTRAALDGVRLVVCAGQHEEAQVIALALRRALETPSRTAALVTPDRTLARRVAAELGRWGIAIDDSAGRPLAQTPPGAWLRLLAGMAVEQAAPAPLLAVLKHPLALGGEGVAAFRAKARALERLALRGPRPAPGLAGVRAVLQARAEDGDDREREAAASLLPWLDGVAVRLAPLMTAMAAPDPQPLPDLLALHVAAAEALAAGDGAPGAARLWAGDAGEAAAAFVAELSDAAAALEPVAPADYPALLEACMAGRMVRPRYGRHPRLHIWGPLEARLQHADLVCLGGLNEGTWPSEPDPDPWMSRPMRTRFGLPPHERRIGLAAHDFAQLFCAGEVLLTRADRVGGTPTVPSRWLSRLSNALEAIGGEAARAALEAADSDAPWLGWQAALDAPDGPPRPVAPPAPRPPVAARPRRLSVTQVETWMRDPYSIYARHILRLSPLDPIDADPGAAARGTFIHDALDRFVREYPDAMPADALDRLTALGREAFGEALSRPGVAAFWWPRFARIAEWFVAEESRYREDVAETRTELRGEMRIDAPGGEFRLTAFADRVDRLKSGALSIIDYKTGSVPSQKMVEAGFSPQLPLEAAIALAGGFDVKGDAVERLEFWRLTGGETAGEIKPAGKDVAALAAAARAGLAALVARFDDPATPYLSHPDPVFAPDWPDYDHLARVQEWSVSGGEDGA